jgi:hypothetical protein
MAIERRGDAPDASVAVLALLYLVAFVLFDTVRRVSHYRVDAVLWYAS